jgi:hypothetical protein
VVTIHEKGDTTDRSNYRGISLLSTSHKILLNILLARLIPYADEIIGYHQCVFRRHRSTTDQIFYIRQILEKNGSMMVQYISYLEISRKPTIQLGGKYYTIFSLNLGYPGN